MIEVEQISEIIIKAEYLFKSVLPPMSTDVVGENIVKKLCKELKVEMPSKTGMNHRVQENGEKY